MIVLSCLVVPCVVYHPPLVCVHILHLYVCPPPLVFVYRVVVFWISSLFRIVVCCPHVFPYLLSGFVCIVECGYVPDVDMMCFVLDLFCV